MSGFSRAFVRRKRIADLAGVGVRDVERVDRGQSIIAWKRKAIGAVVDEDRRGADVIPREETVAEILKITNGGAE